jgi:hypothetical protein
VDVAHFAPELVARAQQAHARGAQQQRGRLDQRHHLLAQCQPQVVRRGARDQRGELGLRVERDAHFKIDAAAIVQPHHRAHELVARAGAHGHAAQQRLELVHVARVQRLHLAREPVERALVFLLHGAVQRDHLAPVVGQARAAAACAPGAAQHERFVRQIVHGIDRIPGRLVRQGHGLGRLRDRAMLADGFEQADARGPEKRAEFGFERQPTYELVGLRGHHGHLFCVAKYTKLHNQFGRFLTITTCGHFLWQPARVKKRKA